MLRTLEAMGQLICQQMVIHHALLSSTNVSMMKAVMMKIIHDRCLLMDNWIHWKEIRHPKPNAVEIYIVRNHKNGAFFYKEQGMLI